MSATESQLQAAARTIDWKAAEFCVATVDVFSGAVVAILEFQHTVARALAAANAWRMLPKLPQHEVVVLVRPPQPASTESDRTPPG